MGNRFRMIAEKIADEVISKVPKGKIGILEEAKAVIDSKRDEFADLAMKLHANPELAMNEFKAVEWQKAVLSSEDFKFKTNSLGLPTAFEAASGEGERSIAFLTEYDALPGIGHACGHNLIAACGIAAAVACGKLLKRYGQPGVVKVIGCPAEEALGGKIVLCKQGAFNGLDAALMAHPDSDTMPYGGSLSLVSKKVSFKGKAAHAAGYPDQGVNALDAVMLLFAGVNAWRQHMPERCRIHGIVTEGGDAPNIVPALASCSFFLRADTSEWQSKIKKRFVEIAQGAALMTGTSMDIEQVDLPYQSGKPNATLNKAMVEGAVGMGMKVSKNPRASAESSDFADVSRAVPGIHSYFSISKKPVAGHSVEFREAAKTDFALDSCFRMASILAWIGFRILTESDFRTQMKSDFKSN